MNILKGIRPLDYVLTAGMVAIAVIGFENVNAWLDAYLALAGINVVVALIALVSDSEAAIIGLVVSSLALVLAFVAGSGTRKVSVA